MKKIGYEFIYQHLWQRRSNKTRLGLIILLSLFIGRLLPYFAPIHPQDIQQEDQAAQFSDRNGLPLGTLLTRDQDHTVAVSLKAVSPTFIQAILATEDGDFYHHGALDLKATARAIVQAIKAKRVVSGASTITMQLARMLEPAPRTLTAKGAEIWLSWRISAGMNKDEILAAYINRLPMGSNIYGVEAASRVYFGIPAAELTLAQASLLAAIPNDPSRLNPYENWQPLKRRQRYVLNRMVQEGYITDAQRDRALDEAISLQPRQQGIIAAPHFLFWVASQLPKQHPPQIQTTLDRPLQQFVETQVREVVRTLAPHNVQQAAAIVIDNHSGEILAYVGSLDYFNSAQFGRNDGVQALRQPGSTLKPFLYQLALEKRLIRPNTVLADVPTHYAIPGAKLYSPSDYSETFYGPARVRIALANSLNVPAVRVLEKVGVSVFLERLHQLGFTHLNQSPEYYGLGLTLGSGEVSLLELAHAYRILAQQGQLRKEVACNVCTKVSASSAFPSSPTWSLITDILSDRYARAKAFGVDSVLNLPFPAAVKTGTSSHFRDTWTVGFTTDYTVATWVGNFNGEPMRQVSGVMGAAPLWNRIMLHLHENHPPAPFPSPRGMVKRPVCALSGLKPGAACPFIVQEYFLPADLADYETHPDRFYQLVRGGNSPAYRLNLPPEYDEWLAKQQDNSTYESASLRILFPRQGDIFLSNGENQRLAFKVGGSFDKAIEWRLNGQKLGVGTASSFFWPVHPGQWTLEVRSGESVKRVSFEVRLARMRSYPRGFSVAKER
ncbi:penicillin-binding protein 1C [Gloeothece verrucosa]|uniref:Penicillin-binding protein 1C n=1 Tax=Gloeothece verrucosa (strain PCC 7822) TaxID=497965 RepID=E0U5D9_GLOV7|nr:penicillin-binding protein 1C [Gloeothece verrucosa]ADN13529.1 penicillin-binding protein 1C [Gloeothece verrucosa PCC 7822]